MVDRTVRNTRIISGKEQEKMIRNGWVLYISKFNETNTEIYNRVKNCGHEKVKVYYTTTSVKGYYNTIALGK